MFTVKNFICYFEPINWTDDIVIDKDGNEYELEEYWNGTLFITDKDGQSHIVQE